MPTFLAYDFQNVSANRSVRVEGSLEDAVALLQLGGPVYRRHRKWTSAAWQGVFVPRFIPDPDISVPPELAMYLYLFRQQNALIPFSQEARRRFEKECQQKYGIQIDVNHIPARLGEWAHPPDQTTEVLLDGTDNVRLNNWSLQRPIVGKDGSLIPGPDERTIVYTRKQGTFWLARWIYNKTHHFTIITEPYFEDVTSELTQLAGGDEASAADTFANSRNGQLGMGEDSDSEKEIEAYESGDESDNAESIHGEDSDDETDVEGEGGDVGIEFHLFSVAEQRFLPLGYMTPRSLEWEYVLNAIVSNFHQVRNLVKVRDLTLLNFHTILGTWPIRARYARGARELLRYIKNRFQATLVSRMSQLAIR